LSDEDFLNLFFLFNFNLLFDFFNSLETLKLFRLGSLINVYLSG